MALAGPSPALLAAAAVVVLAVVSSLHFATAFFLPPSLQHLIPSFPGRHHGGRGPGLHSFTNGRGGYKNMAREFLDAHNEVRAKYGVAPLKWSKKLARYARRWSAERRYDCVAMHSRDMDYGENVFQGTGWDWRAADAVKSWAEEADFYDWGSQKCQPGQVCGHFTQIVWNDTEKVGCGRAECVAGGVFITCSYEPPGNWQGEVPLS